MQLSYNLARRLKAYKALKREIEAIEQEILDFFSKSQKEQEEIVSEIIEREQKKASRNKELSGTSVSQREIRNQIQRRYRAKLREQEGERLRKPIAARSPVRVFAIRIKES